MRGVNALIAADHLNRFLQWLSKPYSYSFEINTSFGQTKVWP